MTGFDVSPATALVPLTLAEVDALLGADVRAVLRDPAAARTLVSRVRATVTAHAEEAQRLRRDLSRMSETRKLRSSPLAAAVEALGRLSVEDQHQVFDVFATTALESLRTELVAARQARLAADATVRRVQLVLAQVAADPELPAAVRERLATHLSRVPDPAADPLPGDPQLPARPGAPFRVPAAGTDPEPLSGLFS